MSKNATMALVLGLVTLVAASGCGKLSDQQQQDAANIVGGVGGKAKPNSLLTGDTGAPIEAPGFIAEINHQIGGALWLAKFKIQNGDFSSLSPYGGASCPAGTIAASGTSCVTSCPNASSLQIACTTGASSTETCNGTSYTFNNESFTLGFDVSGITGSAVPYTGTFGLNLNFSADVSGGKLDGKTLACNINLSLDINKIDTNTPQTPTLDCSNFSCTYDNKAVDCNKVKADFGNGMSCT